MDTASEGFTLCLKATLDMPANVSTLCLASALMTANALLARQLTDLNAAAGQALTAARKSANTRARAAVMRAEKACEAAAAERDETKMARALSDASRGALTWRHVEASVRVALKRTLGSLRYTLREVVEIERALDGVEDAPHVRVHPTAGHPTAARGRRLWTRRIARVRGVHSVPPRLVLPWYALPITAAELRVPLPLRRPPPPAALPLDDLLATCAVRMNNDMIGAAVDTLKALAEAPGAPAAAPSVAARR